MKVDPRFSFWSLGQVAEDVGTCVSDVEAIGDELGIQPAMELGGIFYLSLVDALLIKTAVEKKWRSIEHETGMPAGSFHGLRKKGHKPHLPMAVAELVHEPKQKSGRRPLTVH